MADRMTLTEAAAFARVSAFTIRDWVRRGRIAHTKVGRQLFFDRADVEQYLNQGRVEARIEAKSVPAALKESA